MLYLRDNIYIFRNRMVMRKVAEPYSYEFKIVEHPIVTRIKNPLLNKSGLQIRTNGGMRVMKWFDKLFAILLFVTIILIAGKLIVNNKKIVSDSKYTIGLVTEFDTRGFSYFYYFDYIVNGIQYSGLATPHSYKPSQVMGKRFYVRYYPPDPDNSEILFDQPVSDSIHAPPDGWEELPLH